MEEEGPRGTIFNSVSRMTEMYFQVHKAGGVSTPGISGGFREEASVELGLKG